MIKNDFINDLIGRLNELEIPLCKHELKEIFDDEMEKYGIKMKEIAPLLREYSFERVKGIGIFDLFILYGKEESIRRIRKIFDVS